MFLLRPLPRAITRPLALAVLLAWIVQMGVLLRHTVQAGSLPLATDLASYGSSARWRGIYYHGEKIGFSVSQTTPLADGYQIKEDGQLQLTLMGMGVPAKIRTSVKVDKAFSLRSFAFSLDPGTGPTEVAGTLAGRQLELAISNKSGTRKETRELKETPNLSLNLSRRLATEGLAPGKRITMSVLDPATLKNAPMTIEVLSREVLSVSKKPTPTFKLRTEFSGITSHSWVTETGDVVREESPMGLVVVQETREIATAFAVSSEIRADMYQAAAVVPKGNSRIDDPASVDFLRLSVKGVDLEALELRGAGQGVQQDVVELRDAEFLPPAAPDADLASLLAAEPFIESDAPEIVAEARAALKDIVGDRARAERWDPLESTCRHASLSIL